MAGVATDNAPAQQRLGNGSGGSVRLDRVVKRFGVFTALDGVSLDVRAGEFLTLLGPSGSGKTTILNLITGFETPTEGTIEIGGQRVDTLSPDRRNVGMVFQNYALFPHMTVAQNIAFPLRMRGLSSRAIAPLVDEALEMVRLRDQAAKYPLQLSGGQQQRVAVARALVYRPSVLLMDEPLGALDRRLREIVQFELVELHRAITTTIIYVTHDQDEAITLSDRIALVHQGRIVQVGTPRELYEAPADAFVAEFVGESSLLSGTVAAVEPATCRVRLTSGHVVAARPVPGLAPSDAVRLLVRPERVALYDAEVQQGFVGTVAEALYLGSSMRYQVRLDDGVVLLARTSNRAGQRTFGLGEHVRVAWDPQDAIILR